MLPALISQLLNILCSATILSNVCDQGYQSPVSLLPSDFSPKLSVRQARHQRLSYADNNEILDIGPPPASVVTKSGSLNGYRMKVTSGREIYAFEGIPYAEPPIGENRFRAPVPIKNWTGTMEATSPGAVCLQFRALVIPPRVVGSEDCLTLNIYTPELSRNDINPNLPVMIFIHGGIFIFGSGSDYGPAYIGQQDVILVTLNYRVGPLGFLSTGDEASPGNYGLKDQALAIAWISENIEKFGGDPGKMTLSGQSAGGVSAHLHMMSDSPSRHLVQQAMLFSGNALMPWAVDGPTTALNRTKQLAMISFCPTGSNDEMVNCLRRLSGDVLVSNQVLMLTQSGLLPLPPFTFVPVVESPAPAAFLTQSPADLYAQNKVANIPLIVTTTSNELDLLVIVLNAVRGIPYLRANFYDLAPKMLQFKGKVKDEEEISKKIIKYYGKGKSLRHLPNEFFSNVATDRYFRVGVHKTLQAHSRIAPTYAQHFAFRSRFGYAGTFGQDPYLYGVSHNEDLLYLFNSTQQKPIARTDASFAVVKLLVDLYTNFLTTGEPLYTEEEELKDYKVWNPVRNPEKMRFLQVNEHVKMISEPMLSNVMFWKSLDIDDKPK